MQGGREGAMGAVLEEGGDEGNISFLALWGSQGECK